MYNLRRKEKLLTVFYWVPFLDEHQHVSVYSKVECTSSVRRVAISLYAIEMIHHIKYLSNIPNQGSSLPQVQYLRYNKSKTRSSGQGLYAQPQILGIGKPVEATASYNPANE